MNVLLGISGGIAAYKTPELVRRLRERGAEVQIVMTSSASEFVTETALQAVSGRPIRSNLWDKEAEASMSHIELARWADAVLIAPATAEIIARLASGGASDLLTTIVSRHRSTDCCRAGDESGYVGECCGAKQHRHAGRARRENPRARQRLAGLR